MFDNSDDYDFSPAESSKLASLFNSQLFNSDDSNESLKYLPPKQPKKETVPPAETSKPKSQGTSVICANVILLWKLENGKYTGLNKHGLAIIGNTEQNLYELIIYKEKNNILIRIKINKKFNLINQNDHFSTFYDHDNQNWLIKFDSDSDQGFISKEIQSKGGVIIDNISQSSPKTDDNTQTGNLPEKPKISPRSKRIEIPEVKEDSSQMKADILTRITKMGQQILPSPPINTSTDISDSELEESKMEKRLPPRRLKQKERNIQSSENKDDKNQIVVSEPQPLQCSFSNPNITHYPSQHSMTLNSQMTFDPYSYLMNQNADLRHNISQMSMKLDSVLNQVIGSKNNGQDNISTSKIKTLELRIENLTSELECYQRKYYELQDKCKNKNHQLIESQKNEIERLKLDLSKSKNNEENIELKNFIANQTLKMKDLEKFYQLNKDNASIIDELETKDKEIENLKLKLSDFEEYYVSNEKEKETKYNESQSIEKSIEEIEDLRKTIEIQKLKLKDFEEFYEQNKDSKSLLKTIDDLNGTINILKLKQKDFEDYFYSNEAEKKKDNQKVSFLTDLVKSLMNIMYQDMVENFNENETYSGTEIHRNVAKNIKSTTYKILQELQNNFKSKSNNLDLE